MLRPDFPEIDYVTRKAVSYSLNTNGTLITPEMATILKSKGTKMVTLYGATKETYDHVTRHLPVIPKRHLLPGNPFHCYDSNSVRDIPDCRIMD